MKKAALIALCLALSACTFFRLLHGSTLKPPNFAYVACRLLSANERQADLEFTLSSYNPNAIGLKNVTVSYELFTEGRKFLQGRDIQLEIKPRDSTRILVPAEVVYLDVFRALGPVAEKVLANKKTIPVRIDAVISGKPTLYNEAEEGSLFSFSLQLSRTEEVPLPREQIEKGKDALQRALKRMF